MDVFPWIKQDQMVLIRVAAQRWSSPARSLFSGSEVLPASNYPLPVPEARDGMAGMARYGRSRNVICKSMVWPMTTFDANQRLVSWRFHVPTKKVFTQRPLIHYPTLPGNLQHSFFEHHHFFRSTRQTIYFSAPFSLFFMAKRSYVFLFLDHVYRARLQNRRLGKLGEPLAIPRPTFNQCAVTPRSKLQQVDTEGRLWLPSGYD